YLLIVVNQIIGRERSKRLSIKLERLLPFPDPQSLLFSRGNRGIADGATGLPVPLLSLQARDVIVRYLRITSNRGPIFSEVGNGFEIGTTGRNNTNKREPNQTGKRMPAVLPSGGRETASHV